MSSESGHQSRLRRLRSWPALAPVVAVAPVNGHWPSPSLFGLEGARERARRCAEAARAAVAHLPGAELAALADYVVERTA